MSEMADDNFVQFAEGSHHFGLTTPGFSMSRQIALPLTVAMAVLMLPAIARAVFTTVINVPPDPPVTKLGSNTQLNLFDGGTLPSNFEAAVSNGSVVNAELNVFGGTVGDQLVARLGSTINIRGGIVGQFFTTDGANVIIDGGRVVNNFTAIDSDVKIVSGRVDNIFNVQDSSVLNISGGSVGNFLARVGTTVNVSGGSIGNWGCEPGVAVSITGGSLGQAATLDGNVRILGGTFSTGFTASNLSQIELFGSEFRVNGNPIGGLASVGNSVPFNLAPGDALSGTLADGTPIAFSSWSSDSIAPGVLKLTAAALPAIGPATIVASTGPVPLGIRQGQTLVVDNGAVVPGNFSAGQGSTVEIQTGGKVGANLEAVAAVANVVGGTTADVKVYVGGTLNVASGSVGNVIADGASHVNISGGVTNFADVIKGATLNMTGGSLTSGMNAQSGGIVTMSAGVVGNLFRAFAGSNVTISGGQIGTGFTANSGSNVAVSGGTFGDGFNAAAGSAVGISGGSFGDSFKNLANGSMRISGGEFRLNGVLVPGLSSVGSSALASVPAGSLLSGIFADGTPFAFSSADGDNLTAVTLVSAQVAAIGGSLIDVSAASSATGLRSGQTLTVQSGGQLGTNFNAGLGSTLRILPGGSVGKNLEAVGGTVDVQGGSVGENFDAFSGSAVNISGGTVGTSFTAHNGSLVNITGGLFGASFQALDGSTVNLVGTQFLIDGSPISQLPTGSPFLFTTRAGTLSGHFADGSAFSFPMQTTGRAGPIVLITNGATLNLTLVPEPTSIWLFAVGMAFCGVGRRGAKDED